MDMEPSEPQDHPEGSIEARIVEVLRTCYDPEIPVDIYEMGLIYAIAVEDAHAEPRGDEKGDAASTAGPAPTATAATPATPSEATASGQTPEPGTAGARRAVITMTLTSPACPVAGTLPIEVQQKVTAQVEGLSETRVDITWDPPWSIDRMSDAAKLQLGMM